MNHRTRVGTFGRAHDVRAGAVRPQLQLVARGGAKSIAGRQDHRLAVLGFVPRQFANRRRLPHTVDAHEEPDRNASIVGTGANRPVRGERRQQCRSNSRRDAVGGAVGAQFLEQRVGGGDADVRAQQNFFDHVELILGE